MRFLFITCLLALLPSMAVATEPQKPASTVSALNMALPIHQKTKLHPELSDPVLGDQAQIVEWAWSPQYAERFGLQPQPDGLPNGGLWLVGVKIELKQYRDWQRYTCNIVGLMDNKLPILIPSGEMYAVHPSFAWHGGLPGKPQIGSVDMRNEVQQSAAKNFSPGLQTWYKKPANKRQENHPENSDGFAKYISFYRNYQPDIAFFEIEVGCSHLGNPDLVRTEIRFPTRIDGKDDDDPKIGAVFEHSAIKFDIPDNLMRRIYPYTQEANDWSSCLMRRIGGKTHSLTWRAEKSKRFGNTCEPITGAPINR